MSIYTHLKPSLSWKDAPIMLSPRLAIWEASTQTAASGGVICSHKTKKGKKKTCNYTLILGKCSMNLRWGVENL